MDTDLDHDDAIGRRFGALRTYTPPVPLDDTWRRVEAGHRRRRSRHYAVASVVSVITVVGSVSAVANLRSSDRRVHVVTPPVTTPSDPPIVSVRPPAPVGGIDVQPTGPYRAGQSVRAFVNSSPTFRLDDPVNETLELCFAYGGGEICDGAFRSQYIEVQSARGAAAYDMTLPGWVHTPAGLQSCREVGCRLEIADGYGARIGTSPLAIESGPEPTQPARLNGVHRDESLVSLHVELQPDPSYVAANLPPSAGLPPGGLSLCAFAERLLCDALVRPDPPPFDGQPHDLTIATNRLLLTTRGWVDCVDYVCAIAISRTIDVMSLDNGGTQAGDEIIAIVPYRLPSTTPEMPRPSLRLDRTGPFAPDEEVTVTLHDPPSNVGLDHLQLGQCNEEDLRTIMDCRFRFGDWTRLPDGSLRQQRRVTAPCDAPGCYLAITPPGKGYPDVARTERFTLAP